MTIREPESTGRPAGTAVGNAAVGNAVGNTAGTAVGNTVENAAGNTPGNARVNAGEHGADSQHIGSLLRLAGPREPVPSDRLRRVRAAVEAEWRDQVRLRARRRALGWSLAGATGLATAALVLLSVRTTGPRGVAVTDTPGVPVATMEVVTGAVQMVSAGQAGASRPPGAAPRLALVGETVREGDAVETTTGGRAAMRLAGGVQVRVDRGTRLRVLSSALFVLDEGAVYVDSSGRSSIVVRTAVGQVRDIGTAFEVRLLGDGALRVRVRDGRVQLTQSRQSFDAGRGEELTLDGSGRVGRRAVPVSGAEWAWAATVAKPFDLEGQSLRAFLDWISGDNGWELRFADAATERKSATTIVHGSIRGLTPEEALAAVLPTVGVEHELDSGVLRIRSSNGVGPS
jgi:hypothetical protein